VEKADGTHLGSRANNHYHFANKLLIESNHSFS
jgi:hypothetical protein